MNNTAKVIPSDLKPTVLGTMSDSMRNIDLANKAISFLNKIVAHGKNAEVLMFVGKAFVSKKANKYSTLFTKDGLIKGLEQKVFLVSNQESALKASKHDNYYDYWAALNKCLKAKKPLDEESKEKAKGIIAKAQVLRKGYFSQYVHGEIGFMQLMQHHGIEIESETSRSVAPSLPTAEPESKSKPVSEESAINFDEVMAFISASNSGDDLQLLQDAIVAKLAELNNVVEVAKSA